MGFLGKHNAYPVLFRTLPQRMSTADLTFIFICVFISVFRHYYLMIMSKAKVSYRYIHQIPNFPTQFFIDEETCFSDENFDYELSNKSGDPDYPPKVPVKNEGTFHIRYFKLLEPMIYRRFLELLPSLSLRLFSFTRKEFYVDTVELRGIEVERFYYNTKAPHPIAKNGRLHLDYSVKNKIIPYLSIFCLYIEPNPRSFKDRRIVKKYKRFGATPREGLLDFERCLEQFHSGVKFADFKFYCRNLKDNKKFDIEKFISFLQELDNVEKLRISFEFFGADSTIFGLVKKAVQEWLKTKARFTKVFYLYFATNVDNKIQTEVKAVYFEGKLMRILSEEDKEYITEEFVD